MKEQFGREVETVRESFNAKLEDMAKQCEHFKRQAKEK